MKLAFSTLGCPAWDLDQILTAAHESGYQGVEWRGYRDEMEIPHASIFAGDARAETRRRFTDAGLEFACLSSSVRLADLSGEARGRARDSLASYAELAAFLHCRLVRV